MISRSSKGASSILDVKSIDLLWAKAYLSKIKTTEFVEVPMITTRKRVTLYNFSQDSLKYEPDESVGTWAFQRMLFIKNLNKEIKERIVTYIPDKEYLIRRKAEMSLNSIRKMQRNFSGYIEYRDLSGDVIQILRIKNGNVVRVHSPKPESTKTKDGMVVQGQQCEDVCFPKYEWICRGDSNDHEAIVTCREEYVGMECFRDCWWVPDPDPNPDPDPDPEYYDCNGDLNGTAFDAACGCISGIPEFRPVLLRMTHVMEL